MIFLTPQSLAVAPNGEAVLPSNWLALCWPFFCVIEQASAGLRVACPCNAGRRVPVTAH